MGPRPHTTPAPPALLVLVLSIDREPWRTIETEGQRRTWAAPDSVPDGCRVVFYDGRGGVAAQAARAAARLARVPGPAGAAGRRVLATVSARAAGGAAVLDGDRLRTRAPEAYAYTLPKLLAALRWAASGGAGRFDYVYRANTSAYVDLPGLRRLAAELPRERCYAGWLGRPPASGPPFVKGAGILLSRDLVEDAAAAADDEWPWGTTDDAALGAFLAARGVPPTELARGLLRSPADVAALPEDELRATVQFRCKSQGGPRVDHLTMLALHERLRALAPTPG